MLVVVLLHDGGQRAGDADAVAAHEEGALDAVLVGEGGAHGLGVLGAELEDLRDLDAAGALEGRAAVRAGVAGLHAHEVGPLVDLKVAARTGAREVVVDLVGAAGPRHALAQRLVADQAHALRQAHGPDEALVQAGELELLVAHEVVGAKELARLDLVELVVAGDDGDDARAVLGHERERLARAVLGEAEERGHVLDAAEARGVDLLERAVAGTLGHGDLGRGGLDVGREAAVAVDELGLAGVGERHELDGGVAADLAGVGHDGQRVDAAALGDAGVGGLLLLVALLQRLLGGGEAVGVLHDELAAAHEAEARAHLVTELVLDLVERARELLVGAQLVLHEVGEGLLVRGAEGELAAVAVGDAHELGAVGVPAPGLVPELGGREDGHHHLLGADALHLVADDGLDLADRAPRERQVAVEAGGGLADHAGAQQQAVARELGLGRVLLQRGRVELGHLLITLHVRSLLSCDATPMILRHTAEKNGRGRNSTSAFPGGMTSSAQTVLARCARCGTRGGGHAARSDGSGVLTGLCRAGFSHGANLPQKRGCEYLRAACSGDPHNRGQRGDCEQNL